MHGTQMKLKKAIINSGNNSDDPDLLIGPPVCLQTTGRRKCRMMIRIPWQSMTTASSSQEKMKDKWAISKLTFMKWD